MSIWRKLKYLRPSVRRTQNRDMEEELESLAAIAGPRELGNITRAAEQARAVWGWAGVEQLHRDLRYALRSMRRSPGFTITAVLSLALGIGANSALFSLLDTVLLRNLPVHDPERLFFIENVGVKGNPNGAPPYPCFERIRDETDAFAGMAAFTSNDLNVNIDSNLEAVFGQYASGSYFEVLGLKPFLGRLMTAADEQLNPPVAVISHSYWKRRFGGDPGIIGKAISLGPDNVKIVGVTPPEFVGIQPGRMIDITVPITLQNKALLHDKGGWWFYLVARLKPNVSAQQARAEVDPIFQNFMGETYTPLDEWRKEFDHIELLPASKGQSYLRERFSHPLLVLMAIVGLVLLIGCANLANLFLARATSRRREFAVRLAIGAGRGRLIRQLLAETLLLFSFGAASGLILAHWGITLLTGFFAVGRSPVRLDAHIDLRVLAFTTVLTLLSAVLFGLAPAVSAVRRDAYPTLKDSESHVTATHARATTRQLLVVAQVALSLVLLVVAGLFIRTLVNLDKLDGGFRPARVLTLSVQPLGPAYQGPRLDAVWANLLARVRSLPGVRSASLSTLTPLSGRDSMTGVTASGFFLHGSQDRIVHVNTVSDGYFATLGIPVLLGRDFVSSDVQGSPKAAILNETAAKFYFGDRSPLGNTLDFGNGLYQIIGVVGDAKYQSLRESAQRFAYVPVTQPRRRESRLTLSVKSYGPPAPLLSAVRQQTQAIGPNILINEVMTMQQQIDANLVQERLMSLLSGFFGVLALLLSAVGLYGTLSQVVIQRTSEIGIRVALGATRGAVVWMILRRSLATVCLGVVIGVPAAFFATRPVESLLYGLKPTDATSLLLGTSVLLFTALLASYLPARRASHIDPTVALRYE